MIPDGKRRSQVTMVFPDTKCSGWVAHRVLGVTMHVRHCVVGMGVNDDIDWVMITISYYMPFSSTSLSACMHRGTVVKNNVC